MKNGPYNNFKRLCLSGLMAILACCCALQAHAQFIPIDSGFAEIIRLKNPGLAGCINNYRLDTTCAKATRESTVTLIPPASSNLAKSAKSFAGLEYFSKNYKGSKAVQVLIIDSNFFLGHIPLLPPVYTSITVKHTDSITQLPYMGDSVKVLYCRFNRFTSIAPLPPKLEQLTVSYSYLTALPALPASLKNLDCERNIITALPALTPGLITLDCSDNRITSIPPVPSTLSSFDASRCYINTLPAFSPGLNSLICDTCKLTALPATLPDSLILLSVAGNMITALPPINAKLHLLWVGRNEITSLPTLAHTNIGSFNCSENKLTDLPLLPDTLYVLDCSRNQIQDIIRFPKHLSSLYAQYNNIASLPPINQELLELIIVQNPISCLPALPSGLTQLQYTGTNITCIPNKPVGLSSNLPICGATCRVNGISGQLFADYNNNCVFDSGDVPLRNRILKLDGLSEYTSTGVDGRYNFVVNDTGTFTYKILNLTFPYEYDCTDSVFQANYNGIDTITSVNIPVKVIGYCHNLVVDIAACALRNNRHNYHSVYITNTGNDTAYNAYVDIAFDPEITPLASNLPWSQQLPGNVFRFQLGNIAPFQDIAFTITDSVSITATLGQTACVQATIFPHGNCIAPSALWDSSHVELSYTWEDGDPEINFLIKNTGKDMGDSSEYRIYEEELLMVRARFKLKAWDSLVVSVPANGHIHWMEADQRPGHPGFSKPRVIVEMIGTPPFSLGYYLDIAQDDDDDWVEIDCHEITGSFDPNAKEVFPAGAGADHLITKNDELEYIIRFQNTGNDTAINIKVTDTLDLQHLDITSFTSGASSHPYTAAISGNGVVTWTFADIMLPDSVRSEPASHGFVKFKIKQKQGNVPGTRINNFVDIYFDYNAPVRTNTAFVTIEEKNNIFPMKVTGITEISSLHKIKVYPNPFMDHATFNIKTALTNSGEYMFELLDIAGRTVSGKKVGATFDLDRAQLNAGMYFFRITQNGALIGTGKVMAR